LDVISRDQDKTRFYSEGQENSGDDNPRVLGIGSALQDLVGAGLVILEGGRVERPAKIKLAVGDDDVKMALRDDPIVRATDFLF